MKKKKGKRRPPVPTGRDERAEEPRTGAGEPGRPLAPDGVSGDWS